MQEMEKMLAIHVDPWPFDSALKKHEMELNFRETFL